MEYEIMISETFLEEIGEINDYISLILKAEKAAKKLREKIKKSILILKNSPKLFTIIDKTDRGGRDYRRIVVDNYVIIYTIIEKERVVMIAHIYYSVRNYLNGGLL